MMRYVRSSGRLVLAFVVVCAWRSAVAWADITMKLLIVNPSETEVKEFHIRSPLPAELKPEHVLDADGLKVEFDSQAGAYFLVGTVTLKPKESVTRRVVLQDVWVIPTERLDGVHHEVADILKKLSGSPYQEQGQVLASAIERTLSTIEANQDQPFLNPEQHISRYHESIKTLQLVEADLVSLRQLMVMAALVPQQSAPVVTAEPSPATGHERGQLSIVATWRLIFIILGLLGFVSVSFFLVWQRQLKLQLAKQAAHESETASSPLANGNGKHATDPIGVSPSVAPRLQPKTPLSS